MQTCRFSPNVHNFLPFRKICCIWVQFVAGRNCLDVLYIQYMPGFSGEAYFQGYVDIQGHLVGNKESNTCKKKKISFLLSTRF